jgi:hypothetical protein
VHSGIKILVSLLEVCMKRWDMGIGIGIGIDIGLDWQKRELASKSGPMGDEQGRGKGMEELFCRSDG